MVNVVHHGTKQKIKDKELKIKLFSVEIYLYICQVVLFINKKFNLEELRVKRY